MSRPGSNVMPTDVPVVGRSDHRAHNAKVAFSRHRRIPDTAAHNRHERGRIPYRHSPV